MRETACRPAWRSLPRTALIALAALLCLTAAMPGAGAAASSYGEDGSAYDPEPPKLRVLMEIDRPDDALPLGDEDDGVLLPLDIRREALKEAALSYGARGGLAMRTYQIRRELETRSDYLDKVFDFRQLLIPAPSGLLIEPPVIGESADAMTIEQDGQVAAVADRIYNINPNARISATARHWRQYLEREWGDVERPPVILLPEDGEERQLWRRYVKIGWDQGIQQASEIFRADLDRLIADFEGMVRFRKLLAQGMVSEPFALQIDRGITGGGNSMRIGDRAVQITGKPELVTGYEQWRPASR